MGPVTHFDGFCWTMPVDGVAFPETDDVRDPSGSRLILSEDGRDLGPAHSPIDSIRMSGGGLYAHWNNVLYFSTSDNSDPASNGRAYVARRDSTEYFAAIARRSLGIVNGWAARLPGGLASIRGKRILEIGPGRTMGTVLTLAALGGEVLAVDRFAGEWQPEWHPGFLTALRGLLSASGWPVDLGPIDGALAQHGFSSDRVSVETRPMEELSYLHSNFADLSFSHSTFEHFYDFEEASQSIAAVSAEGGLGVHDVDFRDHRNVGTPLDFLLCDDTRYEQDDSLNDRFGRGNRVRSGEMGEHLIRSGFDPVEFYVTERTEVGYLQTFLPELRRATVSRFSEMPERELEVLSGTFVINKPVA